MEMKRSVFAIAVSLAVAGCASLPPSSPYVGRPIVEAVRALGPPDSVADYQSGGRYFGWSTSDVRLLSSGADNPASWLEPINRTDDRAELDMEQLAALPDYVVAPEFQPSPCSLTLVAEWDTGAATWIARRAIRRSAGRGGSCGMRVPG